ncbi:unnamed protein product [Rotaria sp. Silwood1]|nr:unnamed protein product [Rotaria sp. Silwood1]
MIRRRMNKTRFVSESIEWILQTDQADFKAYQYSTKLETYGQDPQFYELIDYIKRNYLEKDLQRIEDIDTVVKYFNLTINTRDPFYLLQAYTAETGFYSTLNVHLTQLHLENLTDKENLRKAYRGMMITNNDLKQYKIGTRILTKTFSSSSKQWDIASKFLDDDRHKGGQLSTICVYEIRNQKTALDIQDISLFPYEEEVLILPYSAFKIIDIRIDNDKSPNVEIELKECEPW